MLPTIDISLIGVITLIWGVIKTIWDYFTRALNWITQRALALFIGSKFWATAAFLACALIIIGFLGSIFNLALSALVQLAFSDNTSPSSEIVRFLSVMFPIGELKALITFSISAHLAYYMVVNLDFTRRALQRVFKYVSSSWKT